MSREIFPARPEPVRIFVLASSPCNHLRMVWSGDLSDRLVARSGEDASSVSMVHFTFVTAVIRFPKLAGVTVAQFQRIKPKPTANLSFKSTTTRHRKEI